MHSAIGAAGLAALLHRYPLAPRYWIAFSGGLDSSVLLHLCTGVRELDARFQFSVVHVHHGLHPGADDWLRHCESVCREHTLPFHAQRVAANARPGESPEAAARTARYAAFRSLIKPGEVVLTAQHQDDQAETVLLQLLRGAGLSGLAAMPERTACGSGYLLRPLLAFPRSALRAYALQERLRWIDDPSNEDRGLDRNYLRHEVLPALERYWPGVRKTLTRTARHCAEAMELLNLAGLELLGELRDAERNTLSLEKLRLLTPSEQRLVLREWLRSSGCRMPSAAVLERVLREICTARADRLPEVCWSEGEMRRFRGELYLLKPAPAFDAGRILDWEGVSPLQLPDDNGLLTATAQPGPGIAADVWRSATIRVRYRRGGEIIRLPNRAGSRELKKLLRELAIEPWLRARVPLIFIDDRLAAVADLVSSAEFAGDPDTANVRLCWRRPVLTIGPAEGLSVRDHP